MFQISYSKIILLSKKLKPNSAVLNIKKQIRRSNKHPILVTKAGYTL